jgi:hypothetical protein
VKRFGVGFEVFVGIEPVLDSATTWFTKTVSVEEIVE